MTSQPILHILTNISRSNGNHAMEFGQLIGCNVRNIFLEKSYTEFGRETMVAEFVGACSAATRSYIIIHFCLKFTAFPVYVVLLPLQDLHDQNKILIL